MARVWSYRREIPIRSPRLVGTLVFAGVAVVLFAVAGTLLRDARRFATHAIAAPVVASRIALAGGETSTAYELIYRGPAPNGGAIDQVETVPIAVWEAAVRSGEVRVKQGADGYGHVWQPAATLTIQMIAAIGAMFTMLALCVALRGPTSWLERRMAQVPFWTLFGSIWLTVGLPFLVLSLAFAWQDFRLSTSGSTASGTVLIKEVARSGSTSSGPTFRYTVHYRFEDQNGRTREGKSEVPQGQWASLVEQQPVPIQYVAGSSLHRVAGAHERWTLAIFGGVGLVVGGVGALIVRADRRRQRGSPVPVPEVRSFEFETTLPAMKAAWMSGEWRRDPQWRIVFAFAAGAALLTVGLFGTFVVIGPWPVKILCAGALLYPAIRLAGALRRA